MRSKRGDGDVHGESPFPTLRTGRPPKSVNEHYKKLKKVSIHKEGENAERKLVENKLAEAKKAKDDERVQKYKKKLRGINIEKDTVWRDLPTPRQAHVQVGRANCNLRRGRSH